MVDGFLLLDSLNDFLFEALHESFATPWLDSNLEDKKEENVNTHQAPSTPRTHSANLIRPDLFLVIAGEDALAQLRRCLFGLALCGRQGFLCLHLSHFVGVIVAVKVSKSL